MARRDRKWIGGFIRRDGRARDIYWIRRSVGGKRYELSTRCTSERAAIEHLRRFEADPEGYEPHNAPPEDPNPVHFTEELVQGFLDWSKAKGNSLDWRGKQRRVLSWWADRLRGDLKRTSIQEVKTHCEGEGPALHHRIEILKSFYAYLRKEKHLISPAEDPTLDALSAPKQRPEQWKRVKAVSPKDYRKVRLHLKGLWGKRLDILASTAWHVTELCRFARDGRIERLPGTKDRVLVSPQAKDGAPLRTRVTAATAKLAQEVLEAGPFSRPLMFYKVKAACEAAGVPAFGAGQMRHSVATHAINRGATPQEVSGFLDHKSPATTKRFYATHAVAARVPTLR